MQPEKQISTTGQSLERELNASTSQTQTVNLRRVASFRKCLEKALSQPGQIQWDGVQDIVYVLNHGLASSTDVVRMLKQYLKSNSPTVVLKALTIVDSLIRNCGENIQEKLLSEKWPSRMFRLAEHHADKKVKQAVLQLMLNYSRSHSGTEFGCVFNELLVSLSKNGRLLPSPLTASEIDEKRMPATDTAFMEKDFVRGMDFLQLQFPESSNSCSNQNEDSDRYSEELHYTLPKVNLDIDKLNDALTQCNEASRRFRNGETSRKDVLDQINIAWVIAEKCNVWAENLRSYLIEDLRKEELNELLTMNDRLKNTLRSWERLVSMDIVHGGPLSDSDGDDYAPHESRFHSEESTASECNEVKMETSAERTDRLNAENESLKLALSNAQNSNKSALLAAEAKFKDELKEVKSKAAWRIKELMSQVADHELHKTRMRRETEDIQFKLKSADQALQENSRKSGELKDSIESVATIRDDLEKSLARMRNDKGELETRLQERSIAIDNLRLEMLSKLADLEAEKANCQAEAANSLERIEELARQNESMRRNAEETTANLRLSEEYERTITNLRLEIKRESILRKKAYNHIRELKGNIRVIARVRPAKAQSLESAVCVKLHDEYTLDVCAEAPGSSNSHRTVGEVSRRYEFDACFGPHASQEQVFSETSPLIQSALDGFNVCIFCYGQTGSGKTHTLMGSEGAGGIVPLFMRDLFNSDTNTEKTSVSAYMLELYQEELLDLLTLPSTTALPALMHEKLSIRSDSESGLVYVKGTTIRVAKTSAELKSIFEEGLKRRKTATTLSNIESSRSHLIFTVLLERRHVITGSKTKSKITFVDLAGSERIVKSGAVNDKERLNEAKAINKSLSALGDVISALTNRESFVPYRNHKLTELMRDSLGGNAKTLMVVNISPQRSDAKETLNSLDYAQRVKQVSNTTSRSYETREIAQLKSVIQKQNAEIKLLKASSK